MNAPRPFDSPGEDRFTNGWNGLLGIVGVIVVGGAVLFVLFFYCCEEA